MSNMATTERPVAKRDESKSPPSEPHFERIEFQAPIGFTKQLDEARKRRGLSRAAYIRQAVLLLMQEDKKAK